MIKFFRRKRKPKKTIEEVLECITEDTLSEEDRKDEHKVQHYVLGHCEQMIDTTKTLENEKSEYRVVTSYLKDIQIIEELPEDEAAALRDTANSILTLDQSRSDYLKATKKLTDTQYAQMEQEEETLTESIRTLQANEMYQAAV